MAKSSKGVSYHCPRGPDHEGPCYKWRYNASGNNDNNSDEFIVVVGMNTGNSAKTDNTNVVSIVRLGGLTETIDAVTLTVLSSAGAWQAYLPRRMLLPPGFTTNVALNNAGFSLVNCATLEDALAIL